MIVGYARTSSQDQSLKRQEKILNAVPCERIFFKKISGKDTNRAKLKEMLDYIRENDGVVVAEFSRLARNTKNLLDVTEEINKKDAKCKGIYTWIYKEKRGELDQ